MTEALKQKMTEEIAKLPKNKQEAINSVDWASIVENIGKEFGLIQEEVENLQIETALIIVGITSIEDFSLNIEEQVELSESESQKIAIEIFGRIFEPIANKVGVNTPLNTEGDVNSAFSGLPKNITSESNYEQKIYEIGNKYKFPVDKMGDIESITTKFINGEISSIKYESELSLISELPSDKILEIINDINESIIKPKRGEVLRGEAKKEIPLPPKTQVKANIPLPPYIKKADDIYKDSGIEIVKEENKKTEDQPINIVTSKLFGNTNSKNVVNDYSIPKITPVNKPSNSIKTIDPTKPHDPYREIL